MQGFGLLSGVWFKGHRAATVMAHGGLVSKQLTQQQYCAGQLVNTKRFLNQDQLINHTKCLIHLIKKKEHKHKWPQFLYVMQLIT